MLRSLVIIIGILLFSSRINFLASQTLPNTPWPEWVFHHWVWEDESTQQSAIALVDDYLAHDIPVGAIIIDSPWETGYNTFDWDTTLFPDPQAMIDYFHSKNVRVLLWITTAMNFDTLNVGYHPVRDSLYDYAASQHWFMQKDANSGPAKIKWWKGWGSMVDLSNPNAVAWWKTLMDKILDMGIDGWKCDGTDYTLIDVSNLPSITFNFYSPGTGGNITLQDYSDAYYRLFQDYTRQRLGNDRVDMSRPVDYYGLAQLSGILPFTPAFTPKDIGWACWVGDQDATFDGMKSALDNMYYSDDAGYLTFGSDIGGYREDNSNPPQMRSKELFIRWAQLGAFSPLMENGGGGEHRPWMFDQQTTDIYRTFTNLHYALVPYLMVQSDSLFSIGKSLMQFFNNNDYSYKLGSDIFVAPMLSSSNTITVNFPGVDSWAYMFDIAQTYAGGTTENLTIPLEEYPVFIKASSPLLATLDSVLNGVTGLEANSLKLGAIHVYPNPVNKEFKVSGFEFRVGETYEFRLYDVFGKDVLVSQLANDPISIDVSGLENGVYFYRIYRPGDNLDKSEITGKIVVR